MDSVSNGSWRRRFVLASKVALTVLLIFLLFQTVDIRSLVSAWNRADGAFLGYAALSIPLWILLKSAKWLILVRSSWPAVTFSQAARSFLSGLAVGILTPARTGEIARAWFLPVTERTDSVGLVFMDRYCDLWTLLAIAVPGIGLFVGHVAAWAAAMLACIGIVSIYFIPRMVTILHGMLPGAVGTRVKRYLDVVAGISRGRYFAATVLSVAGFLLSVATAYLLLLAFVDAPLRAMIMVLPITLLTNIVPLTIGNVGVREGVTMYLLRSFEIPDAVSINVAVLLFLYHSVIPGVLGSVLAGGHSKRVPV